MEPGDLVLRIDGDTALGWPGMVDVIRASPGRELELDVLRDDETVTLAVVPASTTSRDSVTGEEEEIGQLGVTNLIPTRRVRVGLVGAVGYGLRRVGQDTRNIGFVLTRMFTGRISPRELGGPVLIGQLSGQAARLGLEVFLSFMALFSVNLAILNILPIPVLDGGHLVFLLLEGVRGRPLSLALRMRLTQFGLAVLLGIMALVFTNDILRVVFGI
jgi:regulator of sigma E protease